MATINKRNGKYCVIYYYVDAKGKKGQKWETFDSISEAKARKSIVEAEKARVLLSHLIQILLNHF